LQFFRLAARTYPQLLMPTAATHLRTMLLLVCVASLVLIATKQVRRAESTRTEGIHAALDGARDAARGKDIALGGGANVAQQYLTNQEECKPVRRKNRLADKSETG
jgi:hypothetical protein